MNSFTLSNIQEEKLKSAILNKKPCTLEFSNQQLHGNQRLPLNKTQIRKVQKMKKLNKGVRLTLSKSQLKKKSGGILPLATLLPLLASGVGAASGAVGLASNVKKLISNKKGKGMYLAPYKQKTGSGGVLKKSKNKSKKKKKGSGMHLAPYKTKLGGQLKFRKCKNKKKF
jgi:hypothetical protein